jgi:uncharacterized glyoxalase superfamily protein PhnB
MLAYENGPAAMDWLIAAFGFVEKERWLDEEGRLTHGELALGEQVVMIAQPTPDYQSPKTVRANYPPAAKWSECPYIINGVLVQVSDVDAVYERAMAHGAVLLGEIEDGFPGRRFRVEDLEGQRWFFIQD